MVVKKDPVKFDKVRIPNKDNKPIKYKNPIIYPQPRDPNLPENFFACIAIGGTGSGKSFSIAKLLEYYDIGGMYFPDDKKPVDQRIIIIAPTFKTNPVYTGLKNLDLENDVHLKYSNELMKEIMDEIEAIYNESVAYQNFNKIYKKYLKVKSMKELTNEEIIQLHMYDWDIKNYPEPKHKVPPVNHVILDDLMGTDAYKSNGASKLNEYSIGSRHKFTNMYFLGQTVKQIPKIIRNQVKLMMLYRYNSKTIIDDLHEIVASALTEEEFEEIYFDATEEKYNFLTIDNTKKDLELYQNFDIKIELTKKDKKTEEVEPEKKEKVRKKIVVDLAEKKDAKKA